MPTGEKERTVGICLSCGCAYAVEVWSNGEIQPIGRRTGCTCGSNEFKVAEDSADTNLPNEEVD